jgi:hypothetical protein
MKPMFLEVKKFLDENDVYGLDKIIDVELTVAYEPQTVVKSIEKVLRIFDIIKEMNDNLELS